MTNDKRALSNTNDDLTGVQNGRKRLGWINLSQITFPTGLLKIIGTDTAAFLQSQATSDVSLLKPNMGQPSALLDRKAHIDACFDIYRLDENEFWIMTDVQLIPQIIKRLETYTFTEDIHFTASDDYNILAIQGPESKNTVALLLPSLIDLNLYGVQKIIIEQEAFWVIRKQAFLEEGYFIIASVHGIKQLIKKLPANNQLTEEDWYLLLLEAGVPLYDKDYTHETLLPATGLEQTSVSYTKGCYQGQEVVAKVRTYGSVGKVLTGLVFDDNFPKTPLFNGPVITQDKKELGIFKRSGYSPTLKRFIAMAYLNRDARVPGQKHVLEINQHLYTTTVQLLPFYAPQSLHQKALKLYDEALHAFAHDDAEHAEALLRQVLQMDPSMANAYEALGVILARRFDATQNEAILDEAITLMQKLHEVNPDEVMAHTNLSMFYLKKGWKELAETEKAKATVLGFKLAAQQGKTSITVDAVQEKQRQLEQKRSMFQQVLDFDSEDPLANYGMGQILLDMTLFAQAMPYLQKSVQLQPSHTLSYLALGQALASLNRPSEAQHYYQLGLEVASRKGDLMPLKQLQAALELIR